MHIKLVRVNLSGIEERLDRLNQLLEAICLANNIQVDPIPFIPTEVKEPIITRTSEREALIQQHIEKKKGR